ncbi:MAG TPA: TetR/AcrR family transcriptional regulator [Nitrososphaera sp.]|nr:TetR/AcrR family transcriptional regulator [Nitrososphaera sp.]
MLENKNVVIEVFGWLSNIHLLIGNRYRLMLPEQKKDKGTRILQAALTVLSKNGYEKATINDIADAAKLSRGLLHYYFKDKEDLVAKALEYGFGPMWDSSVGKLSNARSAEELVDNMIDVLKKNVEEHPDFTALLFEMWVSGRRSAKIRKVFNDGFNEAIDRLGKLLQVASSIGVIKINPVESEGVIRILLAMYHGLAIQLLTNPEKVRDKKMWAPIRMMLLSALGKNASA